MLQVYHLHLYESGPLPALLTTQSKTNGIAQWFVLRRRVVSRRRQDLLCQCSLKNLSIHFVVYIRPFGFYSSNEYNNHLNDVQSDLDALKDILRGDNSYQFDANALMNVSSSSIDLGYIICALLYYFLNIFPCIIHPRRGKQISPLHSLFQHKYMYVFLKTYSAWTDWFICRVLLTLNLFSTKM